MEKRILVRIDDVCPTMDLEKFQERIQFFEELGIKPMLGVVPNCEDPGLNYGQVEDFWNRMRRFAEKGYVIAMHGYKHVYVSQKRGLVCFRKLSEFAGLPYQEQLNMLQKGKKILEEHGLATQWFMAPGHSYDRQTVRALYESGFRYISDGRSSVPYTLDGVTSVPASSIWQSPFNGKVITICMHPNTDTQRSYQKVQKFLRENQSSIATFQEAENWKRGPYFLCRMDELARMVAEKVSLFGYDLLKRLKGKQ